MIRKIKYYKDYFSDFFSSLVPGAQRKAVYVLRYVQSSERWNAKFVKYLRDGLFEIRIEHQSNIYRVFFILDGQNIVLLLNGFQKKSQKTPPAEIEKALKLKSEYYGNKQ